MKIEWLIANVTAPGSLPEQKVFIKLCSIYLGQFRQLLAENDRFGQFWRFWPIQVAFVVRESLLVVWDFEF